ncbi:MAG: RloB family protein [Thermoanaerobaculia bacterium]|nr:RloB family protein [Thermoanaerobaculia bacterium]
MKMKNKRAEQIARKQRHKETIAEAKGRRRGEPSLERPEPTRVQKPAILVVCEGINTEPGYFEKFRLTSATIEAVGEGYNTLSLVRRAEALKAKGDYEQVWCVFDKDDFPASDFNAAIQFAEQLGFGVAYSNQAFEYWLLLHFEDHQGEGCIAIDMEKN